jgi:hypothetical protein
MYLKLFFLAGGEQNHHGAGQRSLLARSSPAMNDSIEVLFTFNK